MTVFCLNECLSASVHTTVNDCGGKANISAPALRRNRFKGESKACDVLDEAAEYSALNSCSAWFNL